MLGSASGTAECAGEPRPVGQDLRESTVIGYGLGNDRENQQGNDPETG
ncbi:hypothetical protein ACIPJS_11310 [Streptomyces sp. NPDC086783]